MNQNVTVTVNFETERSDLVGRILITGVRHEHLSMLLLQHSNLVDIILATEKKMPTKRKFLVTHQGRSFRISISFMPYITNKDAICIDFIYDIVEQKTKDIFGQCKEDIIANFLQPDSMIVTASREFLLAVEHDIKEQFSDIYANRESDDARPQYIYTTSPAYSASSL